MGKETEKPTEPPKDAGLWFMLLILVLGTLVLAALTNYPGVNEEPNADVVLGRGG
jgi:hypothetical protein